MIEARTDRRRARTRAALLGAGQSLFSAHSVDAVSIDDIVQAADVAKGSFYNHFADKEALAREIAGLVRADAEAVVALANANIADPAARVARALAVFVRFATRDPERAGAMMRLFAGGARPDAPMNRGVRADVEGGLAAGRFRGLGAETGVLITMGVVHIAISRALEPDGAAASRSLSRNLAFGLLRGLGLTDNDADAVAARAAEDIFRETAQ